MNIFRKMAICLSVSFTLLVSSVLYNPPITIADTAQYFYDELGRFTQVVNSSNITNYNYDEVGNILSVTNGSLLDTPSVTSVTPTALLAGVKTAVTFTGQNLLSADTIVSLGNNIIVNSVTIEANKITTMLTAQSAITDTVKITFRDNASTVYQANFDVVSTTVVMDPPLIVAQPDSTVAATISLNPSVSYPVNIGLRSSEPTVGTVPSTVTIPAGSTAAVQINTLAVGVTNVTNLNNVAYTRVVSEKPVSGNGVASMPVSVTIMPSIAIAPGINTARPVSVSIAPSVQQPAASVNVAKPVSVTIMPSAATIAPSATIAPPVSVKIQQ